MDFSNIGIYLGIGVFLLSYYLSRYVRNRIVVNNTQKLVKELEAYFSQPLPYYKGSQTKVNWDKVLKMLVQEPNTEKVLRMRGLVKKQLAVVKPAGKTKPK